MKNLILYLIYFPLYIIIWKFRNESIINYDITTYSTISPRIKNRSKHKLIFLLRIPEFRTLFYYRLKVMNRGKVATILKTIYKQQNSLYLFAENIDGGLFIEHGFSTIISARSIGHDCFINQNVTIGHANDKAPTIGNHCRIHAGAIVLGDIKIGDNSIIGAGAVVTKSVPPNCTVVGNPARIIRKDGERVNIKL